MLFVVGTPIGNLSDLTARASEVLGSVDLVACEDTRVSRKLLNSINCHTRTISYHSHSKGGRLSWLVDQLQTGSSIALITDAGTPGISDPGGLLVEQAHEHKIKVVPVPGPSSVITALSVSGFPSDKFLFLGFLPKKKGRKTALQNLSESSMTTVFFESPERIISLQHDLFATINDSGRQICVCRELSKKYEEIWVGSMDEYATKDFRPQGEYVFVLRGKK